MHFDSLLNCYTILRGSFGSVIQLCELSVVVVSLVRKSRNVGGDTSTITYQGEPLFNTTCLTHVFSKAANNAANSISRIR